MCAPFKLFDPLFALCLPLFKLVPLFSLPLDSPPPISMAGTWASGGPSQGLSPLQPIGPLPSLSTQLPVLCQLCPHMPACPKWVSPTIGTESAPVGVGVCHPGPPHFVWKRGTARGAFGSFGPKSDQGAKTFGPTFRANLSTAGGTQWCPVVQLGARECGADGLWVTFTGLPQAVVLGGWSQNPNKIEGPQIHF